MATRDDLKTLIDELPDSRLEMVRVMLEHQIRPPAPELIDMTTREREVLQLVAEGKTGKEIAQILGISDKTVEFHKHGVMETLGLHTTAELTRYALENGIIAMRTRNGD